MFDICLNNGDIYSNNVGRLKHIIEDSETTKQWNKTVLEHYKNKNATKYRVYEQPFIEWFEDKEIDIKKVDSLIEPEIKEVKKSEKTVKTVSAIDKKHPNYKDLGAVATAIVKILTTIDTIKHSSLKDKLKEKYPHFDVEYNQSLSQAFRGKENIFYKDEIGHKKGYWYLKSPDIYTTE